MIRNQSGNTDVREKLILNLSFSALVVLVSYSFYLEYVAGEASTLILLNFTLHSAWFTGLIFLMQGKRLKRFRVSRSLFILAVGSAIATTSLLWGADTGLQYFLLLAMVGCDYFFRQEEKQAQRIGELFFLIIFLGTELFIILPEGEVWKSVRFFNSLVLGIGSLYLLRMVRARQAGNAIMRGLDSSLVASLLPRDPDNPADYWQVGEIRKLETVSVLFADLRGYTGLSERFDDEEVVALLNNLYLQFDDIAMRYGVEKIKTNGDEYMAATGVPIIRRDAIPPAGKDATRLCHFAFAIIDVVETLRERLNIDLSVRVGMATGAVTGGIIGNHKPHFDIWGKTVNLASRLEQFGQPDEVTVCPVTADILRGDLMSPYEPGPDQDYDARYRGHPVLRKVV